MVKALKNEELTEEQVRKLFRAMHTKGTSTNNVVNAGRGNSAKPFDGDKFLDKFEEMLEENFEIADSVYKKFGA